MLLLRFLDVALRKTALGDLRVDRDRSCDDCRDGKKEEGLFHGFGP